MMGSDQLIFEMLKMDIISLGDSELRLLSAVYLYTWGTRIVFEAIVRCSLGGINACTATR